MFHSKIWSPTKDTFSSDALSPSKVMDSQDVAQAVSMPSSDRAEVPSWLSSILDPTSLSFDFDHSCLEGLDDLLLHAPRDAFAAGCWDTVITPTSSSPITPINETKHALVEDSSSLYRSSYISLALSGENPIPVFLAPSVWSEDDSDSDDSDEDSDDSDSYYSNGTITGVHTIIVSVSSTHAHVSNTTSATVSFFSPSLTSISMVSLPSPCYGCN